MLIRCQDTPRKGVFSRCISSRGKIVRDKRGMRGKVSHPTWLALSKAGSSAPGCTAKSLPCLAAAIALALDGGLHTSIDADCLHFLANKIIGKLFLFFYLCEQEPARVNSGIL